MFVRRKPFRGDRADALRRRIRRNELGMTAFQIDQLSKKRIVFRIADARIIENVILVVRILDRFAESLNPLGFGCSLNRAFWNR